MVKRNKSVYLAMVLWASPWTLLGVILGCLGLCSGGQWQRRDRIVEFHGGWLQVLLRRIPISGGAVAITLGHTVLGRTADDLDHARRHELVHVGQYERWGPLFVPAYLLSSLYLILRGRDPYLENPFERAAYDLAKLD